MFPLKLDYYLRWGEGGVWGWGGGMLSNFLNVCQGQLLWAYWAFVLSELQLHQTVRANRLVTCLAFLPCSVTAA